MKTIRRSTPFSVLVFELDARGGAHSPLENLIMFHRTVSV